MLVCHTSRAPQKLMVRMTPQAKPKITIFYDGACPLCSREINHYRGLPASERIAYVDIAADGFDAARYNLDRAAVNRSLHIITDTGEIFDGVDAFAHIWRELGGYYRYLVPLTKLPVSRQLMLLGYRIFATLRPRLPGRKKCDVGNKPTRR